MVKLTNFYRFLLYIYYSRDIYIYIKIKNYLLLLYRVVLGVLYILSIISNNWLDVICLLNNFLINYSQESLIDSGFVYMNPGSYPGPSGYPSGGPPGGGPPGCNSSILPPHDYNLYRDRYSLHTTEPKCVLNEKNFRENGMEYTYIFKRDLTLDKVHVRLPDKSLIIFKDEARLFDFIRYHHYLINRDSNYLDSYLKRFSITWGEYLSKISNKK